LLYSLPSSMRTQLAASLAVILAALFFPPRALEAEKEKEKPHVLLRGTVFTAGGLALPGVPLTIKIKDEGKPKWRAVSDRRGEFAVRLPVGHQTYEVSTHSDEHENQTKTVEIDERESVNVIFRLSPKEERQEKNR
jgi:hypothetical protein